MAEASQLAHFVASGLHGRRRAGQGESFWQFRHALPGDSAAAIDWRRSGRADSTYIREREWESAQTVNLWCDRAQSMAYKSAEAPRSKAERARLLALATAILLSRGGEKIALLGSEARQGRSGEVHLQRIAMELEGSDAGQQEYGILPGHPFARGSRAVFMSDFLGPIERILDPVARIADQGISGCLVQILDPAEETFPFDGRTIFESMSGAVRFETQQARALQQAYRDRLQERRELLEVTARRTGWRCLFHRTSDSPRKALLWLYMALEEGH